MGVPYHANSLHQLHRTGVLRHSTALTDACPREVVVEQCLFLPRHCTEMHPDIPHGIQNFFFSLCTHSHASAVSSWQSPVQPSAGAKLTLHAARRQGEEVKGALRTLAQVRHNDARVHLQRPACKPEAFTQ